jgi:hypothetical protein
MLGGEGKQKPKVLMFRDVWSSSVLLKIRRISGAMKKLSDYRIDFITLLHYVIALRYCIKDWRRAYIGGLHISRGR